MKKNNLLTWDNIIESFCRNSTIENSQSQAEVFKVVENYYYEQYGRFISERRIEEFAKEITKSICKKRGIKFV